MSWHKKVFFSHFEYPIYDCAHSYSISLFQTPFWNMSLAARTKQWTARNPYKYCVPTGTQWALLCRSPRSRPSTRSPALCPNSSLGTWKKGVFTLVPSEYHTRAPCPGTMCERCLIQWGEEKKSGWPESCQAYVHSGQIGLPSANICLLFIDKLMEVTELM